MLTRGGAYRYNRHSLTKNEVYQAGLNHPAKRIGEEYNHGHYTVGNSFNPLFSIGQSDLLRKEAVGVGDFIGLFVVPEHHTLLDVAMHVVPVQYERGYQAPVNCDGMVFTVEARKYSATTLEETGSVELKTPLNGIPANVESFKRSPVSVDTAGYFIGDDEVVVLGIKIEAVPADKKVSLADVTCRLELTGHVFDYVAPIHV